VYLAGAIDRVPFALSYGWRKEAKMRLASLGCAVYDPTINGAERLESDPSGIVRRNTDALLSSAAVLAELVFPAPHYGTAVEIEAAVDAGIPVVVWMGGEPRPVYLARHGTPKVAFADELDDAVAMVARLARRQANVVADARLV
jgi:hypothetical protein